jgi:mono/diheme cytochrome c family protein
MWKKIALAVALLIFAAAGVGFGYLYLRQPAIAPPLTIKVAMTPERIERGRHLFHDLADCEGCHSERDFTRFGGPVAAGGLGKGFQFPAELGMPGTVIASNITPDKETGIGEWTDGEKIRAIREGISRDGRVLFPMMPYPNFRHMSDEDVQALVAYLNTMPAVRSSLSRTKINFPVSLLIKSAPQPAGPAAPPDRGDKLKYGEYLVRMGSCEVCHTRFKRGQPVASMRLAGGREFRLPMGAVVSANITPDADTGIGKWSEQQFLDKFYQYKDYAAHGSPAVGPEGFTLMPWLGLSQLSPEELIAIFTYLKAQPPVHSAVETHPGFSDKS